jgi:hypothetical protein
MSSDDIDLSALILDRSARREKQANQHMEKVRARVAEEARIARRKRESEVAKVKQLAEQRANILANEKARMLAISTHISQTNAAKMNPRSQPSAAQRSRPAPYSSSDSKMVMPDLEITKWNKELRLALMEHETDTRQLIHTCLANGIFPIPESHLEANRKKNMIRLKNAAEGLKRCGVFSMTEEQLLTLLSTSEKGGLDIITKAQSQPINKNTASSSSFQSPAASSSGTTRSPANSTDPNWPASTTETVAFPQRMSVMTSQNSLTNTSNSYNQQGYMQHAHNRPSEHSGGKYTSTTCPLFKVKSPHDFLLFKLCRGWQKPTGQ